MLQNNKAAYSKLIIFNCPYILIIQFSYMSEFENLICK